MNVSVTIPCYRSASTMLRCIQAVKAQTHPVHEIIVIDDCSPDDAGQIAHDAGCRVTRTESNIGLAASMNLALEQCQGEFLAKIDSDVELTPTWLDECLKCFTGAGVAGVGGRMVEFYQGTVADRWRAQFMPQHFGGQKVVNPVGLFGCDQLFRVSALKDVGGWNPKYRTNHEDMDLSLRLKAKKWHLVYTPFAIGLHLRKDTVASVLRNFWMWYHTPYLEAGHYASVEKAAELIPVRRQFAIERMNTCITSGAVDLMYPTLLLYWWMCLRDLEQVRADVACEFASAEEAQASIIASVRTLPVACVRRDLGALLIWGDHDIAPSGSYFDAFQKVRYVEDITPAHWQLIEVSARMVRHDEGCDEATGNGMRAST